MPQSQLAEMVKTGDLDGFEASCLDLVESGGVEFAALAEPFRQLQKKRETERAQTLGQMLLEGAGDKAEPAGLLAFLVALLNCCPEVEDFARGRWPLIARYTATSRPSRRCSKRPGWKAHGGRGDL